MNLISVKYSYSQKMSKTLIDIENQVLSSHTQQKHVDLHYEFISLDYITFNPM